jgi:sulfate adenylyltransferase subunit 2
MLLAVSEFVAPLADETTERVGVRYRTVGDLTVTGAARSTRPASTR